MKVTKFRVLQFILLLSILLNLALGYKYAKTKYLTYRPDHTYNRKGLFEKLTLDSNSIVFVGNSLTQQFELAELLKDISVKNRGINGDNTFGLLNRLAPILKSHPQKIFLEIGINDLIQNVSEEDLLNNYRKIINNIKLECPDTKIYIQSLFPINTKGKALVNSKFGNENIRNINKKLKVLADQEKCTFIDTYIKFELNGEMNSTLCLDDGLHLSAEGYLLWTQLLKSYIND